MTSTQQSSRKVVQKEVTTIGFDLAKTTVPFVSLHMTVRVLTRRQYSKGKLLEVTATMGPCHIDMEAWCAANYLGPQVMGQGNDITLMPPQSVKPFVKRDKSRSSQCSSS